MNATTTTAYALFFIAPVIAYAFASSVIALAERMKARNAEVKRRGAEYQEKEAALRVELFAAMNAGDRERVKAVRNEHEIAANEMTKRG